MRIIKRDSRMWNGDARWCHVFYVIIRNIIGGSSGRPENCNYLPMKIKSVLVGKTELSKSELSRVVDPIKSVLEGKTELSK